MISLTIVTTVALILLYPALGYLQSGLFSPLCKLPGPWLNGFTRAPLKLAIFSGRRAHYIDSLHKRYGPFVRVGPDEVAVSDIQAVKTIHRSGTGFLKSDWYPNTNPRAKSDEDLGLFSVQTKDEAAKRRKLYHRSSTPQAVKAWEPQIAQFSDVTATKIRRDIDKHGKVDIWGWYMCMTTDVIGVIAFGEPFGSIELGRKTRFIEDLEVVLFLVGLGSELRLGRLLHYIYIPFRDIGWIGNMLARLQQQGEKAVRTTKAAPPGSSRTLFSKMIPEDGSEAPLSDNVMAQEAMTAVVAGSDSTTAGICYTIYAVLRHPEVKRKLQQELSSCSDSPGFEELQSKQYLKWVIEEGLRLYPPIPTSLARKVPDNGAILGGYMLPSGTDVVTQAMTMHNNPSVFLEPERFIPERWENSTPAMKDHMMAFGGSMRSCVGEHIARVELTFAIASFFRIMPDAALAPSTNEKSMAVLDFFTAKPRGQVVDITLKR